MLDGWPDVRSASASPSGLGSGGRWAGVAGRATQLSPALHVKHTPSPGLGDKARARLTITPDASATTQGVKYQPAKGGQFLTGADSLHGASLSFATTAHLRLPPDPPSRKPTGAQRPREQTARSIPGRALASSMLGPPVRAPEQDSHLRSQRHAQHTRLNRTTGSWWCTIRFLLTPQSGQVRARLRAVLRASASALPRRSLSGSSRPSRCVRAGT